MSSFDWKGLVGSIAPWIGTALGGPLAGSATEAVCNALGLDKSSSPEQLSQSLQGITPEQVVALRKADQDYQVRMQQAQFQHIEDLEKLNDTHAEAMANVSLSDRESARGREEKTGDHWTPRLLAAIMVLGFLGCVGAVLSGSVAGLKDPSVAGLFGTLVGYVSSKTDLVYAYFFGSSAGSDAKTQLLYKSTPTDKKD